MIQQLNFGSLAGNSGNPCRYNHHQQLFHGEQVRDTIYTRTHGSTATTPQHQVHLEEQVPQGVQVHTDASIQSISSRHAPRQAGLGIQLQGVIQGAPTELLIQAVFREAQDALHAEMLALQLASKVVQHLQIKTTVYNTDSQLLAAAVNSEDPISQAPDWRIMPSLTQFITNNNNTQFRCIKIPRNDNKTTHSLAKFAWQGNIASAITSCTHFPSTPSVP